jgi:hypothetical protein
VSLQHHNENLKNYNRRYKSIYVVATGFDLAAETALQGNCDYYIHSISVEGKYLIAKGV